MIANCEKETFYFLIQIRIVIPNITEVKIFKELK